MAVVLKSIRNVKIKENLIKSKMVSNSIIIVND